VPRAATESPGVDAIQVTASGSPAVTIKGNTITPSYRRHEVGERPVSGVIDNFGP